MTEVLSVVDGMEAVIRSAFMLDGGLPGNVARDMSRRVLEQDWPSYQHSELQVELQVEPQVELCFADAPCLMPHWTDCQVILVARLLPPAAVIYLSHVPPL
jgi:hypothetical protein